MRDEPVVHSNAKSSSSWPCRALALLAGTLMLGATASEALAKGRTHHTLSLEQAQRYADNAQQAGGIPITINDHVLAQLNHYIGTSEGRRQLRAGLALLPRYRPMIERKLAQYKLPLELLAVPLYESGYDNQVVSSSPTPAAGIWQFIPQTARKYRLKVNDKIDERKIPEKETDAAMRYFSKLYRKLGDWRLALWAYNEGEEKVKHLIRAHKTRDPWVLEGLQERESYLSNVMAMIIVLKNPGLLD